MRKKSNGEKEAEKPKKKKKTSLRNKILLLKCKKVGGGKSDKCTNTCCDKGTNTLDRDQEEDDEEVRVYY